MGTLDFSRRVTALTLAGGLVVLAGCGTQPTTTGPPSSTLSASPSDPEEYAARIVRGTNNVRAASHLPRLRSSKCAQTAALKRALALIGKPDLTHAPLNGVIADCKPATIAAENLSRASARPAAVINTWMHSPGHRSNLLDPSLTQIGVGCVLDGTLMLCSQVFLGP